MERNAAVRSRVTSLAQVLLRWGLAVATASASPSEGPPTVPEAVSLLGAPLHALKLSPEEQARLEADLTEARARYAADPADPEGIIWVGRRLAYLGRYREAIETFSRGLEEHPEHAALYRHRGHRYITTRQLGKAVADLEKAASLIRGLPDEIEQDGAPNAAGIPRSTSHSNIWYHLGLAYYLQGDFENALRSYEACMAFARVNDDMLVATVDWLYMTYRRLGRDDDARKVLELIEEDMDILENSAYHQRLLMYKGLLEPETLLDSAEMTELDLVTQGYGVANWYFVNGERARARALLERIVGGSYWPAFGHIAAEADLMRWPAE
jgi:tetratricopeptide (TPR) repeat protein